MTPRVCACGCGASMNGTRPQARYASDACRSRAWKARTGYRVVRARKPRQNAKPREGVTVYFPTVEEAEDALYACEWACTGTAAASVSAMTLRKAIDRRKAR